MEILITGRNVELDSALKSYVNKKMSKLVKLNRTITECEVVFEEEKVNKNIEVILHMKNHRLVAKESAQDIYAAVDKSIDNLKKQIRRVSDKDASKKYRSGGIIDKYVMPVFRMGRGASNRKGQIVKVDNFANKPMSPEEAKLELEVLGKEFIMFKNSESGKNCVLYKKGDGNYGLVEPEF